MGAEPSVHDVDIKADALSHVEDAAPDYARNIYAKFVPQRLMNPVILALTNTMLESATLLPVFQEMTLDLTYLPFARNTTLLRRKTFSFVGPS